MVNNMTIFEYIFGGIGPLKTDAEKYMEERNKEYSKKAAAYKKREMLSEVQKTIFDYLMPISKMSSYKSAPNTYHTNTIQVRKMYEQQDRVYRTEADYRDAAMETKKRLQEKYGHANIPTLDCDDCDSFDFEKEDASLFEINTVMFDQISHVYKVCGKIKRGRFSMNDIVTIKDSTTQYSAKVKQIIRQGEVIDYANVSSGVIILFIPASGGLRIDKTSKITKSTLN